MTVRRYIVLGAVVMTLITTGLPASAEEAKMNALQTALSSTTVSGYMDTSIEWTPSTLSPAPANGPRSWWHTFRVWLRAHGLR